MLVRIFRQNQPAPLFLLPLLVAVLWPGGGSWHNAATAPIGPGMPLFMVLHGALGQAGWLPAVAGMLLVLGLAVQVNHVANESELFERRNYLPALLLPLFLALFHFGLALDPAMAGMPFVLLALRKLWSSQGRPNVLGPLFDAGLLIGLAALCHLPYAFMVVVVHASISVMRPFHWREHVVPLLGLGIMLFLGWAIVHLVAPGTWDPQGSMAAPSTGPEPSMMGRHWLYRITLMVLSVAFAIAGIVVFTAGYARGIIREKNTRTSFVAFTLVCAIIGAFDRLVEGHVPAILAAAPLSIFLAWPLVNARRNALAEIGVLLLFGLGLWARWLP